MLATVVVVVVALALAGTASAVEPSRRIIGGNSATIERFPWQVSVQLRGDHYCGGSIITKSCVLTAAHCIDMSFRFQIRAGTTHLSGGRLYDVIYKKIHEDFNRPAYSNDVAILKIRREFELGNKVQIVPLADSRPVPGTLVTVSGWGATSEDGITADSLRACTVKVISLSECRKCYDDERLTKKMLCAGLPWGGKDACKGDSGGPLVHNGRQVGVVSFGKGCGRPLRPGIYADVVSLRAWITDNAGIR